MDKLKDAAAWWAKAGRNPGRWVGADESKAESMARSGFLAKAKRSIGKIPMGREVVAMFYCLLDPTTPHWVKGIVAAALAYFVLPIDAIPDIIPFIGMTDDAGILAAAYSAVAGYVTPEHREKARAWIEHEHPRGVATP